MDRTVETTLPMGIESPRMARGLVESLLVDCGLEQLVPVASVLVSDVVTEAVLLHAPVIELRVHCDETSLRVEVHNEVADRFFTEPSSAYRRRVLETFADDWANEHRRGTLWFELRARRAG